MRRSPSASERMRVLTMNDGEIIDEMVRIIETDGELLTDEQAINKIARLLKREGKI